MHLLRETINEQKDDPTSNAEKSPVAAQRNAEGYFSSPLQLIRAGNAKNVIHVVTEG